MQSICDGALREKMTKSCAAIGCVKRCGDKPRYGEKLSFHKFPHHDPSLLKKWVVATRRQGSKQGLWKPSQSSLLCSDHFKEADFEKFCQYRKLREGSIPSWFVFSQQHMVSVRKSPQKRSADSSLGPEPKRLCLPQPQAVTVKDHNYSASVASRQTSSPLKKMVLKVRKLQSERKKLRQKLQRRDKRLKCLKSTLDAVKESKMMDADLVGVIRSRFENPLVSALFQNEVVNGGRKRRGRRYSQEIKKLCLTLHYYSPRAYRFLAKNFSLPGTTSLQEWTRSVGCEVGVFQEVVKTISAQVGEGKIDPNCCLMVDEMAIRKAKVYSQRKDRFEGYIDLGSGEIDDTRLATNALVFMAVGLKGAWRHPVAYFLTDHMSSETLAQLSRTVLCALSEAKLKVRAFVADGLQSNLAMFGWLGARNLQARDLELPVRDNFFLHPATAEKVYVLLDVVHMLKLLRNLLGEYKDLRLDGEDISWRYLQALHSLQHREGIRAGNKLSRLHIQYEKNKMKVKLAAQVFSSSVAKALQFLEQTGHPDFIGADATARFILMVDQAFDYLNTSNPRGKGFKAPTTNNNLMLRQEFLADFSAKLCRLKTASGVPILETRRRTPVLGLCLAAQTVLDVSRTLLEDEGFEFVLSYKMSQDHLELLFGRIRRMGGYNNNPNAAQLQQAMRRLALHNFVSPSAAGNCIEQDDGIDEGLLQIRRPNRQRVSTAGSVEMPAAVQHLLMMEDVSSEFAENCVAYICGYVCRKLVKAGAIRCGECVGALLMNDDDQPPGNVIWLVKLRDNGGLFIPSGTTYAIAASAEQHLTALSKCGQLQRPNLSLRIQCSVLDKFMTEQSDELFPGAQDHMFAPRVDECHVVVLLKQVVERYIRVRLHACARNATLSGMQRAHMRHSLHKQVLFAHQ